MEANILNRVRHVFQGCSEEEVIVGTEMVMMMMMVYNQLLFHNPGTTSPNPPDRTVLCTPVNPPASISWS